MWVIEWIWINNRAGNRFFSVKVQLKKNTNNLSFNSRYANSLVAQMVKNLPATRETWVQSLAWEDPLEEGMPTHSSILAWRIPCIEEPGGLQSMGSQRVGHNWVTSLSLSFFLSFICSIQRNILEFCLSLISHIWFSRKLPNTPRLQLFFIIFTTTILV